MLVPLENNLNYIDLFAGAGGFSLGLSAAGFTSLGTVEYNSVAFNTMRSNVGEAKLPSLRAASSIENSSPFLLKREMATQGIYDLDLLVASPPCQGFSKIGRGKLNSLSQVGNGFLTDPRNELFKSAIDFLTYLKPKAFLFENVPGMLHHGSQNIAEIVCRAVEGAGYTVKCALLNSAWYGVPQIRERIILIAFRNDVRLAPSFPVITHFGPLLKTCMSSTDFLKKQQDVQKYFATFDELFVSTNYQNLVSVSEAFEDLPPFTNHLKALRKKEKLHANRSAFGPSEYTALIAPNAYCAMMRNWHGIKSLDVKDHFCRWTARDFPIFAKMKPGDTYPDAYKIAEKRWHQAKNKFNLEGGKRPVRRDFIPPYNLNGFNEKWKKLYPDRPSWTVTAHLSKDTYSHIHFDSKQARAISIREAARLQSFPDGYIFEGSTGDCFTQIGNAVPPLMAKAIGLELFSKLSEARSSKTSIFDSFANLRTETKEINVS